jgi:hypothetical protein
MDVFREHRHIVLPSAGCAILLLVCALFFYRRTACLENHVLQLEEKVCGLDKQVQTLFQQLKDQSQVLEQLMRRKQPSSVEYVSKDYLEQQLPLLVNAMISSATGGSRPSSPIHAPEPASTDDLLIL